MLSFLISSSFVYLVALPLLSIPSGVEAAAPVNVTAPTQPSLQDLIVVHSDFLALSLELAYINLYFGNTTDTVPQPVINYLQQIRSRTGSQPVRVRVGGNSAETSTYIPTLGSPMIQITKPATGSNEDNQPVDYGPEKRQGTYPCINFRTQRLTQSRETCLVVLVTSSTMRAT